MPHSDTLAAGVLGWCQPRISCKLIGGLKTIDILKLNQDFHSTQNSNAGYAFKEFHPLDIFFFLSQFKDIVTQPLFLSAQVIEKVHEGLK